MTRATNRDRIYGRNIDGLNERRRKLEQDLAYYEDKLAEVRLSPQFAELNLTALYESRTWHVRKLLTVLPVH